MKYRIKKIDGHGFFPDKDLDELFNVEASEDGERWFTVSTHLSAEGAEKKKQLVQLQFGADVLDPTGIELKPGDPDECPENGEGCNECNHFLTCFPEWKDPDRAFEGL